MISWHDIGFQATYLSGLLVLALDFHHIDIHAYNKILHKFYFAANKDALPRCHLKRLNKPSVKRIKVCRPSQIVVSLPFPLNIERSLECEVKTCQWVFLSCQSQG